MKKPKNTDDQEPSEAPQKAKQSQYKPVYVLRSKCGYEGDGELIGDAYGDKALVKIDHPDFNKIITVKKTDLKKR